jgi:hypothetical protein
MKLACTNDSKYGTLETPSRRPMSSVHVSICVRLFVAVSNVLSSFHVLLIVPVQVFSVFEQLIDTRPFFGLHLGNAPTILNGSLEGNESSLFGKIV